MVLDPKQAEVVAVEIELKERRRQVRGLLLIAVIVVLLSVLRAGVHGVFPHGWWRLW